jgi:hypothetical protein
VIINALHRVNLGANIFAYPQNAPGEVVEPGGQLDLDYMVDPPSSVIADLHPALSVSVEADPNQLWPQLFVNQGYTSETFTVPLVIDPIYFGTAPPGKNEILTGVQIDFNDGVTSVRLTEDNPNETVTLRIPLLPRLLGDPQAKKFSYKVTNLLGADFQPDEESDWVSCEGESPVTIIPAGGS